MNLNKNILTFLLFFLVAAYAGAQVKIGNNHKVINPASLLELESANQGLLFSRVRLSNNLTEWRLDGDAAVGMVVFNTNDSINAEGLYCWFNGQWNSLITVDFPEELDTLHFNNQTRQLYDDGDSVNIASGRVHIVDSITVLQDFFTSGQITDPSVIGEGDIFYVSTAGLYIRNAVKSPASIEEGFIYVSAFTNSGYILYANYSEQTLSHDTSDFSIALDTVFYGQPEGAVIFPVIAPVKESYFAFAVPSEWSNPQISMKVKNSSDDAFFQLNNCWRVSRQMEYEGEVYQVWSLDVPMRASVMHEDMQFRIE